MNSFVQKGKVFFLAALALVLQARGALSDYTREELTDRMGDGWPESAQVFHWYKIDKGDDSHFKTGQAWAVRFDLSSHHPDSRRYRFTTRLGLYNTSDTNASKTATLQQMADEFAKEGRKPLVAINGSYFDTENGFINLYSALMSDGRVLRSGSGLLTGTGDQQISMDGTRMLVGGQWPRNGDRQRIFNEHGFYSSPNPRYSGGTYHPPEDPAKGDAVPSYPRSLVGTGINHEYGGTYLVFFVSDGRQDDWSYGVEDRDAIDMMVSIGCETVGENDGGGSAGLWINNLPAELAPRDANYINKSCDGHPRAVAEGVFMMYEEPFERRVTLQGYFANETTIDDFDCLDNAIRVADPGDYVDLEPLFGREGTPVELRWPVTNTVSITLECQQGAARAPVMLREGASLTIGASSKFQEVMFENADGSPATVEVLAGKTLTVGWDVTNVNYRTWSDSGLYLTAPLTGPTVVDCRRPGENATFARVAVTSDYDEDMVFDDLQKLVHPTDPDMVAATFADVDTLRLRWLPVAVVVNGRDRFGTLDDALRAARKLQSPVLEIVRPVTLAKSAEIDFDCTIRTQTGDAAASAVLLGRGVALSVGRGARVLVENVLTTNAANAVTTEVRPGGTLAVSGTVGLGVVKTLWDDPDMTEDPQQGRIELAGALTQPVLLKSGAGNDIGNVVGFSSLPLAAAQAAAPKLVNADDDEIAGEAYADGGAVLVRWGVAVVSDEDAVMRLEQGGGSRNFRSLRMLFRCMSGDSDATVVVYGNCPMVEPATIPAGVKVAMVSLGEDPVVVSVPNSGKLPASALIAVNGALSVTNVVFDGSSLTTGESSLPVFGVEGGGSLEFGPAAGVQKVLVSTSKRGAVCVNGGGTFTMRPGSRIEDCTGGANAAVNVVASGTFNAFGGRITGNDFTCGGVYLNKSSTMNVAGAMTIGGNRYGGNGGNVTVNDETSIVLADGFTGSVGVRFYAKRAEDRPTFGKVAEGVDPASASHFTYDKSAAEKEDRVNDRVGSVVDGKLVWAEVIVPPPPLVRVGSSGEIFGTLQDAVFAAEAGDTLTLLGPVVVSSMPVRIDKQLTITGTDPSCVISRLSDGPIHVNTVECAIEVAAAGVVFDGVVIGDDTNETNRWPRAFVHVLAGASLTLEGGTVVRNVRSSYMMREGVMDSIGRSAAGVRVNGELIVKDGVRIENCINDFWGSCGGGVFVSGPSASVRLEGGVVTGCSAATAGGVYVERHASAYVSGNAAVTNNANGNLYVTAESPLEITDVFTGRIDYHEGVTRPDTETNIFADVTYDYAGDLEALAAGAIRFTNEMTRACGVAVTNETGEAACYVWNTALADGPTYEKGGVRWTAVGEVPPQPSPDPGPVPPPKIVDPYPIAFTSIEKTDAEWVLVATNARRWCWYSLWSGTNLKTNEYEVVKVGGQLLSNQWNQADGPITNRVPVVESEPVRFWIIRGASGEVPAP